MPTWLICIIVIAVIAVIIALIVNPRIFVVLLELAGDIIEDIFD